MDKSNCDPKGSSDERGVIVKQPESMEVSQTVVIAEVSATFKATSTNSEMPNEEEEEEEDEEGEPFCSVNEILDECERMEESARVLLGGQDEKVCTFVEGYKPRQALYSCLTCSPAPNVRGICYGCSIHCHDGHHLVEMYTKRQFRCDCGNSGFNGRKCTLYEEKPPCNDRNKYNQNFEGFFCNRKCTYPDPNLVEDMIQCNLCEDWFHLSHCGLQPIDESPASTVDLVCGSCVAKFPWITSLLNSSVDKVCISSATPEPTSSAILLSPSEEWRKRICDCSKCDYLLDSSYLDFLRDSEDLFSVYEAASHEKTQNDPNLDQASDRDIAQMLVKDGGPEAAIKVMEGYNFLKEQLATFFTSMAAKGGMVKKEDVEEFSSLIKRRKLE